jgi:beta-N-acetylhexosaminidase
MRAGELFLLGFHGTVVPDWLRQFEEEFGLGGVILFDTDVERGRAERNIIDPDQLRGLCAEIHSLPSRPLVFIDQEGGKVRRLKTERGFAPLPSAEEFNRLPASTRVELARASFGEMAEIGIDFNLAPVIDLNTNPANPGIGALGRSFSNDPQEVRTNVALLTGVAREVGLQLCLKHFPGLGGAETDTHDEGTDLTGCVSDAQLQLFRDLWAEIPGAAVLLSHGTMCEWDEQDPVSVSEAAVSRLRAWAPRALLITDDLHMGGMQVRYGTVEASMRAVRAGVDLLCISNNERAREGEGWDAAGEIARRASTEGSLRERLANAIGSVRARKGPR